MQFQVPQFIETEDKIVGPLSLRQFMYLGAAGLVVFILYYLVQTVVWFFLSAIIVGAGMALAFVKINGRSLIAVIRSASSFYWKPQTYVWRPEKPAMKKEDVLKSLNESGFLDNVISGVALKDTWRNLQTKGKDSGAPKARYEIYEKLSGDREIAKRVDYR